MRKFFSTIIVGILIACTLAIIVCILAMIVMVINYI